MLPLEGALSHWSQRELAEEPVWPFLRDFRGWEMWLRGQLQGVLVRPAAVLLTLDVHLIINVDGLGLLFLQTVVVQDG